MTDREQALTIVFRAWFEGYPIRTINILAPARLHEFCKKYVSGNCYSECNCTAIATDDCIRGTCEECWDREFKKLKREGGPDL